MSNQNLISVVIPTFNRLEFLEEAILSVINQTYKQIEILVIDDGSNINYAEKICNKYKQCYYLYKENGGLSSARNYGIKSALVIDGFNKSERNFYKNKSLKVALESVSTKSNFIIKNISI